MSLGVGRQSIISFTLICHSTVWSIWKARNDLIFAGKPIIVDQLVDTIPVLEVVLM